MSSFLLGVHRNVALLLAISSFLLISVSTAFLISAYRDETGMVSNYYVTELPKDKNDAQILEIFDQIARSEGVNIYRRSVLSTPENRVFYGFIGDQAAAPVDAKGVFRSFDNKYSFQLKPYKELNEYTLLGSYRSNADAAKAPKITEALTQQGFKAVYTRRGEESREVLAVAVLVFTGETSGIFLVVLSTLLAAAIYQGSKRYRDCLVKAVCGRSRTKALLLEYFTVTAIYASLIGVFLILGLPLLYAYNRFAHAGWFLGFSAFLCLIGFAVLMLGQSITFLLASRKEIFTVLKGYRPNRLVFSTAALLQILAFLTVSITLIFGANELNVLNGEIAKNKQWEHAKKYASVYSITPYDTPGAGKKMSSFIQSEEGAGRVLIANVPSDLSMRMEETKRNVRISSQDYGILPPRDSALVINSLYLKDNQVLDISGKRIENLTEEEGHMYALLSDAYPYSEDTVLETLQKWASNNMWINEMSKLRRNGVPRKEAEKQADQLPPAKVTLIKLAPDQDLPSYQIVETEESFIITPQQKPKLLLFAPLASKTGQYSPEGMFFADPQKVHEFLIANELTTDYRLGESIGEKINENIANLNSRLMFKTSVIALAALVLLLAGALLTRIYCEMNAKRHFVESINGVSPLRTHWGYLTFAAALVGFFCLLAFNARNPLLYPLIVSLAALYLLFMLLTLRLNQNRLKVQVLLESNG